MRFLLVAASFLISLSESKRFTIYFVRHADSIWNAQKAGEAADTTDYSKVSCRFHNVGDYTGALGPKEKPFDFKITTAGNGGVFKFIGKLRAGGAEIASEKFHAEFLDAPLSAKGIWQAKCLQKWIGDACVSRGERDACTLAGFVDLQNQMLMVSNLRRTRQTFLYGFQNRCLPDAVTVGDIPQSVSVVNALQEEGCAADARPDLSNAHFETDFEEADIPTPRKCSFISGMPIADACVDQNMKNNKFRQFIGQVSFPNPGNPNPIFIVVGHSTWFRDFLRSHIKSKPTDPANVVPNNLEHRLAKAKLGNASVVKFILETDSDTLTDIARIVPGSTELIYGYVKNSD